MGRIPTGPEGKHCRDCAKADPHQETGDNDHIFCGDRHLIYKIRPPETPACQYFEEKRMMAAIGLDGIVHYRRPEGDPLLAEAERRGYAIVPVEKTQ